MSKVWLEIEVPELKAEDVGLEQRTLVGTYHLERFEGCDPLAELANLYTLEGERLTHTFYGTQEELLSWIRRIYTGSTEGLEQREF
jgi:hypothetical protein